MPTPLRRATRAAFATLALALPALALAQATAPVTHDRHLHRHNDAHPTVIDEHRFTTSRDGAELRLPAEEEAFTFAVFGDRTGGPNEGVDVLAHAIADVNLLEPDLVMTVGDMIQGYNQTDEWLEQMEQYKDLMGNLVCPWFPVAGNHDVYWRGDDPAPPGEHEGRYEVHFGPLWYAFEHKRSVFIVLYSDEGDPDTGEKSISRPETQRMSPEQLAWLEETLDKAGDAPHVFVFLHHPRWRGGRYGDDWDKVHRALVDAGNVSAVFAGHIHRMQYENRDGIEYVTLATVGGHQRGSSPRAGYLHHFNLVTVRDQQIALASVPVGETMDVRQITREVSEMAGELAQSSTRVLTPLNVADDGGADQWLEVTYANPVDAEIDLSVALVTDDPRWTVYPDHVHAALDAGERQTFRFRVSRPAGSLDGQFRPLFAELGIDLRTDTARFAIPTSSAIVPGSLKLVAPPAPERESVLSVGDEGGAAAVPLAAIPVGQVGPLTLECWVRPTSYDRRDGVVGSDGYGFWFNRGRPIFYVRVGNRWVDAQLPEGRTLDAGRWYHFAGVWDGEESRFYIDGRLVDAVEAVGPLRTAGSPLMVGADTGRRGWRNALNGQVDEVRVSTTARYAGDEPFTPARRFAPDPDTALLLQMDADQGGYVYDASPTALHAELVGTATVAGAE